ncbi:MAG: hypothetical protein F4X39_00860 [Acidobacteriia bacterium]|nr:hypothetical protein [Terriglobia bacterium]
MPECEDFGRPQLITSTANLDEGHTLLHGALDLMGLSRHNAEFLREYLKALGDQFFNLPSAT